MSHTRKRGRVVVTIIRTFPYHIEFRESVKCTETVGADSLILLRNNKVHQKRTKQISCFNTS